MTDWMFSPIKFQLVIMKYQRAIHKALVDKILDKNATTTIVVLMVVGAG
ncbi:hypothetical protein M8C21_027991 [Ambrosia artemisiifolia]|uniref:Uncharacterized protein n=1 Tax=Ambrosia artemisiifolia TaxID=4212 RepID=A0AAD5G3K6_AMBAR|nr:hypothetical protein M8C21_027991 [Ambrosia artemisiifolia]